MRSRAAVLALAIACAACGRHAGEPAAPCVALPLADPENPPALLSRYCLVENDHGTLVARSPAVVPFDVNSPLFSDYALKTRMVWLPPGARMAWDDTWAFELPPGGMVLKTFAFPKDFRRPGADVRLVETRVLVAGPAGTVALPYVWNDAQDDATLEVAGGYQRIDWIDAQGQAKGTDYLVPNMSLCKKCHENRADGALHLLGVNGRQLNRDFAYPGGMENQLAHWTRLGILAGAPDPSQVPRLPVWNDPATGTVAERARAWLEANCAHCHSAEGMARTSGLFLAYAESDPYKVGVCKSPVAAGPGSGGFHYDIVPGQPDQSIFTFRLASTDPKILMPQLGRTVVHEEGLRLVRDWIAGMNGTCK